MKRLITFNDNTYMPLWQTDLKFVQDNVEQVVTQLAATFANGRDMYIIAGCKLSQAAGKFSVTSGLAMINGEVLYVPPQEVNAINVTAPHLYRKQVYNPLGEKQFLLSDDQTEFRNTWDDSYAALSAQSDPEPLPGRLYLRTAKTIMEIIAEATAPSDTGWVPLPLQAGWTWDSRAVYYRCIGKQVYLKGDIINEGSNSAHFASLPEQYVPAVTTQLYNAAGFKLIIETTGKLKLAEQYQETVILDSTTWII